MKVRMKRKHLLYGIISFFLISLIVLFIVVPSLKEYKVERMVANGEPNATNAIVELIDNANSTSRKIRLIEKFVLASMSDFEHEFYMGPTMVISSSSPGLKINDEESERLLLYYLDNSSPTNNWNYEIALDKFASLIYDKKGADAAISFVKQKNEELFPGGYDVYSEPWVLKLPEVYIKQGEYKKAKDELLAIQEYEKERMSHEDYRYQPSWQWMNYMIRTLAQEGELEEAEELIASWVKGEKEQRQEYGVQDEVEADDWVHSNVMDWKKILADMGTTVQGEKGMINGSIKREDGTPLQGVYVYLHGAGRTTYHQSTPFLDQHAVTDDSGEFVLENVAAGSYRFGFGLEQYHIDGYSLLNLQEEVITVETGEETEVAIEFTKLIDLFSPVNGEALDKEDLNFKWEPVEGADYYKIYFGVNFDGVGMSFYYGDVEANNLIIGIEEWREMFFTSITVEDDNSYPDLDFYKRFLNSDVELSWSVEAYKDNGSHLSSSHGYRLSKETMGNLPTFSFELEKTKADELFLKGKLKEAYELYKDDYEADNRNVYALAMQTMLTPYVVEGNVESEMYGTALKELALATEEPNVFMNVLAHLRREGKVEDYIQWFHKYEELMKNRNESIDMYEVNRFAKALFQLGEMEEARKWFHYRDKDDLSYYVGDVLAFELYAGTDKNEIIDIVKEYKGNYDVHKNWEAVLEPISYDADMKHFIEVYFNEGWVQAEALLPTISSKHNKAFLRQLIE
ncbi:MSCRAMM family protein [Alkalihalobacterium bogoriense]|uniref:MSCRAMM family protein n=1 Tax=Alkalihalobacterium bogoriense TaxID=246272 RepID=UPI00047AE602|nr:carboxypeptidase-like regulatory domain-containing protein [Alkalihalobacterium bogoriense]